MLAVLIKAFSFTLIVGIGIFLRAIGFVSEEAGSVMKRILLYLTLPVAIVVSFSATERIGGEMLSVIAIGIVLNIIMLAIAVLFTRKMGRKEQVLYLLCLPAFNIGAFCLPFIQSFLPVMGSVTACMLDVGNSIMCTGGNYAFTSEYTAERTKKGIDWRSIGKTLITCPPLLAYVIMFLLTSVHIHLPEGVITLLTPIAQANTFVAMLMIGLLFHIEPKRENISHMVRIVVIRNVFAAVCSVVIFFLLPFDLVIRQAMVLSCFGPITAIAPAYIGMCGGDEGMASCASSLTILVSLVTLTLLVVMMGLG